MKFLYLAISVAFSLMGTPKRAPVLAPQVRIAIEKLIRESEQVIGSPQHDIMALAFSPDGTRLAVAVGRHRNQEQESVHLLVLSFEQVNTVLWQSDLTAWVGSVSGPEAFRWSDDGQLLFVQFPFRAFLVDANTGAAICAGPKEGHLVSGGLIGPNSYVVGDTGDFLKRDGRLWFFDLSCKLVNQKPALASPTSGDTAPAAALLAIADEVKRIVILQPDGRQKFSIPDGRARVQVAFLNSGTMLCGGTRPGPDDGSLRCWELNAPNPPMFREYAVNRGGTAPFATSSAGSIVMIAERGYSYNPFTENTRAPLKRYVIWDVESGDILATIAPRKQLLRDAFVEERPRKLQDSLVFAISRNGRLAALAALDSVEVFAIPTAGVSHY